MKFAVTANDRTYSMQVPWWFLLAALCSAVLWQPAAAWASTTFADVPTSHTFHDDIDWMATAGVTKGCNPPTNDAYCPDDVVTRGQMAAFMHRFADSQVATLEAEVSTLQTKVTTLESRNDDLEGLLAGVTRDGDRLLFSGMDLQVVNGTGTTDGTPNGLGNLIVGYDTPRPSGSDKTGSHYLVVGDQHNYTAHGGILAGYHNTASGPWASVTGGQHNIASGWYSAVSGGGFNTASASQASVSGGGFSTASGPTSSVAGGYANTPSDFYTTASGGRQNAVNGWYASVSGGYKNTASGDHASILGGNTKTVGTNHACHPSCA